MSCPKIPLVKKFVAEEITITTTVLFASIARKKNPTTRALHASIKPPAKTLTKMILYSQFKLASRFDKVYPVHIFENSVIGKLSLEKANLPNIVAKPPSKPQISIGNMVNDMMESGLFVLCVEKISLFDVTRYKSKVL